MFFNFFFGGIFSIFSIFDYYTIFRFHCFSSHFRSRLFCLCFTEKKGSNRKWTFPVLANLKKIFLLFFQTFFFFIEVFSNFFMIFWCIENENSLIFVLAFFCRKIQYLWFLTILEFFLETRKFPRIRVFTLRAGQLGNEFFPKKT